MTTKTDQKTLIMAVDDDLNVLKLIRANLSLEGYEVITASNGTEAVRLFTEKKPSLVLMDIMMPGIDGIQTVKLIRESSNVPIIMLTAKDDTRTLEQALTAGADDFLTKPFSLRELTARVHSKIRRTRPLR